MPQHLDSLFSISRRAISASLAAAQNCCDSPGAVDATAGNGHDTLFLVENIGKRGKVWTFDIQEQALAACRRRLQKTDKELLDQVRFIHAGHQTLLAHIPESFFGNIYAATFNLGFLPGSDKHIVTHEHTTLNALESLAGIAAIGGILSVHCYGGHPGGASETEAVGSWFSKLSWRFWRVGSYSYANKTRNPEVLYLAERLQLEPHADADKKAQHH